MDEVDKTGLLVWDLQKAIAHTGMRAIAFCFACRLYKNIGDKLLSRHILDKI
ncbi:hypothetical protein [Mastigocladopsis repens]|uniref:hypothetical protein n=1 Tax=Mastigocladopsis repens TaxID=221287 RepID=UPI0002FB5C1F|nr:hypothetical protein [Mastigocladopsis repens]